MDGLIEIAGVLAILLVTGIVLGLAQPRHFKPRWLLAAAALVFLDDALLTRGYGALPRLLPSAEWNWQGKILALAATLVVASLPGLGWRRSGLTLAQAAGSLRQCIPVALIYCLFFTALALVFPADPPSRETIAFQLTMPGLEEEPFFRGTLLLVLDMAYTARVRVLGADWGWGAVLSCMLFGLEHAFSYTHGHAALDPIVMALTALPSFIAVWLRYRTGSVLLPIVLHNFGNAIPLILRG